ncbi:hypothetical protein GQ457_02G028960 [Hibiscus cannabinus]
MVLFIFAAQAQNPVVLPSSAMAPTTVGRRLSVRDGFDVGIMIEGILLGYGELMGVVGCRDNVLTARQRAGFRWQRLGLHSGVSSASRR